MGSKGQDSTFSDPFRPPSPPRPTGMGSKGQSSKFSEHGHVAYKIKGKHEMQQHGSKHFAHRPTPNKPWGWGQ